MIHIFIFNNGTLTVQPVQLEIIMERVDIKIRPMYRDLLKKYCKANGFKMYALVEQLIVKKCSIRTPHERNVLRSNE